VVASDGVRSSEAKASSIAPGAVTALLEQLARAPETDLGDAWGETLRPGGTVGRFQLVREIGRGGFGVVWEARDRELGRSVAFKALRAGRDALREQRVRREAEAAAQLTHPNLVTLHDFGRSEDGPYLVLELLRGRTLEERLGSGSVPVREALRIAAEIAKGVAHAHAHGVVHRDLKPANVFLCDDGQVKVLDFGLAQAFGRRREDGGTPPYMPPEQREGAPEDERTDVFALGVILHRMLSGELPFGEGREPRLGGEAPELEIPGAPALGPLVSRMVARNPVERPRDATEVLAGIAEVAGELDRASGASAPPVRVRRRRGGRPIAALGAALALAGGGYAAVETFRRGGTPRPAGAPTVVAVADFANETRDPDLDGLSGLLITSLEQSTRLRVLTRSRMFDLLRQVGKEDVSRIDEALAREVGRRAGAHALLLASVRRFDDVYTVELRALDPAGDEYLFALKEQAVGKKTVPDLIDRLSERARLGLRERRAEVQGSGIRVAEAVTANLEAYRHYFEGLALIDRYRLEEGRAELLEALRLDPGFTQVHVQLLIYERWQPPRVQEEHVSAALTGIERLPESDRLVVRAEEALLRGRPEEAIASYAAALERSPGDKRILLRMYWISTHFRGDLREAVALAERAHALDPTWFPAHDALAIALVLAGEFGRAESLARGWAERWPSFTTFALLNGVLLHAARPAEALVAAKRAAELGAEDERRFHILTRTLLQLDDFAEAERLLRDEWRQGKQRHGTGRTWLPLVARYRGKRMESLRLLDAMERAGADDVLGKKSTMGMPAARGLRITLAAGDGDPQRAVSLAADAEPDVPPASAAAALALAGHADAAAAVLATHPRGRFASATVPPPVVEALVSALRARDAGDVARARRVLDDLRRRASRPSAHAAALVLGEICFEARDDRCAIEALDEFQRHHWLFDASAWAYPRSLHLRAVAEERLGEHAAAHATLKRLLAIWKDADPDLPLLAETRALERKLAGSR
jgi:tetratricopeptide (TPR) repeat protein